MGRPKKPRVEVDVAKLDKYCQMPYYVFKTNEAIALALRCDYDKIERFIKKNYRMTFAEFREAKRQEFKAKLFDRQAMRAMPSNLDSTSDRMVEWLGKQEFGQAHNVQVGLHLNPQLPDPTKLGALYRHIEGMITDMQACKTLSLEPPSQSLPVSSPDVSPEPYAGES